MQTKLAISAGLPKRNGNYLFSWWHALDHVGDDTVAQRNQARLILPDSELSATLIASDEAVNVLCRKNVQLGGNYTRLATTDNIVNSLPVLRRAAEALPDPVDKNGILDIIDFSFDLLSS